MSSLWNWIWNGSDRLEDDFLTKQVLSHSLEELEDLERKIKYELALMTEEIPQKRVFNPTPKKKVCTMIDNSYFQRHGPKLIKPMNKRNPTKSVNIGGMIYDPDRKIWLGNDKDLAKFRQAPPLITNLSPQPKTLTNSGMKFDSEQGRWVGNEDLLAIFEDDKQSEEATIGSEFSLSESTIKSFYDCEESFKKTLGGWASNSSQDDKRAHLFLIRSMSISKIINQVKQGYSTVPVSTKSNSATSINLDTSRPSDTTKSTSVDITHASNNNNVPPPNKHTQLLSKYQENSDDWNDVEDNLSAKITSNHKVQASTITNKDEQEEEEDWDIDIPSNGLLKIHTNPTTDIKEELFEEVEEEVEEDWDDDKIPSKEHHSENTKVAAISKSSLNEDDEDWSGLEIPNKLQLKVPISPKELVEESIQEEDNHHNDDEEDWDDVVIPVDFASKLHTKKPSAILSL